MFSSKIHIAIELVIQIFIAALKKDKPKKTSAGLLAHAQTFPVIKEEVEEEEAEAEFFRNQPDSPLTSLYCGTRWKNRTWPDFLNHQSLAVNYYGKIFTLLC